MSSIDSMIDQFKNDHEIKAYAEAQYSTILEQSKKIQRLEEENASLKKALEGSSSGEKNEETKTLLGYDENASSEEIIAVVQLAKLKEISYDRELNLDETKRVEIYSKIVANCRSNKNEEKPQATADALSNEDLIRLVSSMS